MPKSSSLTWPSHADQHVGRLDVAVHDQVGVRVGDGLQHVEEQSGGAPRCRARARRSSGRWAGRRRARARGTAGRAGDTPASMRCAMCGWVEPGEDVAFAPEALLAGAAHQRDVQQLDRGASFEAAVAALAPARRCPCRPGRSARRAGRRRGSARPATASAPRAAAAARRVPGTATRARRSCSASSASQVGGERRVARADRRQPGARGRRRSISSASSRYGLTARQRSGLSGGMRPHRDRPPVGDRAVQVDAAFLPVALHGALGDAAHGRDLGEGEAAEELQVDDLGEVGIDRAPARRARR